MSILGKNCTSFWRENSNVVKISPKYLILKKSTFSKSIIKNIKSWPKLYKITQYHYIDCAGCDSNGIFRLLLAVSQNLLSLKEKEDFS